jgi:hypothetical protein
MRKTVALLIVLLTVACSGVSPVSDAPTYSPPFGATILRVEVVSVEFTDWAPGCDSNDDGCVPTHFWYRYTARVQGVVSGSWSGPEVQFGHLQHAEYIPAVTKDCYVVLVPASTDLSSKIGASLIADRILSRFWKHHRAAIKALWDGA